MVLCLIALPVFALLGIFSVKYRQLTKDALECLFSTVTLRKCRSGLDDKIKSDVTGTFLKYSPQTAKFVYKHYKILSWIILIIILWSAYESSVGVYNYINYGNCNGPESIGFCMLDPTGKNSGLSEIDGITIQTEILYPVLEDDDPIIGNPNAELTVIEFGCYKCPYTKKAEPIVKQVLNYYEGKVNFQFKTFYIPHHNLSYETALAANCADEQGKFSEYHKALFASQSSITEADFFSFAGELGLDTEQFKDCYGSDKYKKEIDSDSLAGIHAGVMGTPTFFINEQKIVGPKPFKTFKKLINKELKKMSS